METRNLVKCYGAWQAGRPAEWLENLCPVGRKFGSYRTRTSMYDIAATSVGGAAWAGFLSRKQKQIHRAPIC